MYVPSHLDLVSSANLSLQAYYVFKNGLAQGTYCSLFNVELGEEYAQFEGTHEGGFEWSVGASWSYSLSSQESGEL